MTAARVPEGGGRGGESQQQPAASWDKPVSVTGKPVQVPLPLSAEGAKRLDTALAASGPAAVSLRLDEVTYEQGAYLEIYLNLPPGRPRRDRRAHYAGVFAPFEPKAHRAGQYSVDVTQAVRRLRAKNLMKGDINVTLVPAVPETKTPSPGAAAPSRVEIRRLSIVIGQ
jgi:hypothetical protein